MEIIIGHPGSVMDFANNSIDLLLRLGGLLFLFRCLVGRSLPQTSGQAMILRAARVSARPVLSALILCGSVIPVAIAVAFTDQLLNQAVLALLGFPLSIWLWREIHQNLNCAEGRVAAAVFVPSVALFFGAIAYAPNL